MSNGFFQVIKAWNQNPKTYAPGSPERDEIKKWLDFYYEGGHETKMVINGKEVSTKDQVGIAPPHDHQNEIAVYHRGDKSHINLAIESAMSAREKWASLPWEHRVTIFQKAADLLCGKYRYKIGAATMLGQSKTAFQADGDAVCAFSNHLRYNSEFMQKIYSNQPDQLPGGWNRMDYRPLEGFVFSVTPFNFTMLAGNISCAPAMMGNVVVWKPSDTQILSARVIMEVLQEAGLPDGVINLVYADGPVAGDTVLQHQDFGGLHFTGSTKTFKHLWKGIGENIDIYKSYPRVVGETGGKGFVLAHSSADAEAIGTAIALGAFDYQGQKCSAASRAYIPESLWLAVKASLLKESAKFKVGNPEDFSNAMGAIIDERSFDKIVSYLDYIKEEPSIEVVIGGGSDKSKGYFVEPTIIRVEDPENKVMCEEIFGPIVSVYVYPDSEYKSVIKLLNETSPYGLTGSVFSNDKYALEYADKALIDSVGNFYLNEKPTGATPGFQPFGGMRASGTNDKVGSFLNLLRWVSPRTTRETYTPPTSFSLPHLG